MIKRIFLYGIVNILILITLSITLNLLGIAPYLTANGLDYRALIGFCLVWGMGGALISLLLSRIMVKIAMGVKVINPNTTNQDEAQLVRMVYSLAKKANLPEMPEVGYYVSNEVNAFATGPTKSRALVAVSTGLIGSMDWNEIEGVLGHEISHVANGDMVTMTLIQGIINAMVMIIARIISFALMNRSRDENSSFRNNYFLTYILEILLSFLGLIVVNWFSRWREYHADEGGAQLAGRENMINALQALSRQVEYANLTNNQSLATLKISGGKSKWAALFSTHPSLEERIARLKAKTYKA